MQFKFGLALKIFGAYIFSISALAQDQRPISNFGATVSPIDESIVYYSTREHSRPDLYLLSKDGIEHNLTNSPGLWEIEPAFSPDGKYLAFGAGESMKDLDLYIMELESRTVKKIASGKGTQSAPSWHPNGHKILYTNFDMVVGAVTSKLWTVNIDGSNNALLDGLSKGSSSYATWSPKGDKIVYTHSETPEDSSQLHIFELGTKNNQQITSEENWKGSPVFSPDAKKIYFVRQDENNRGVYQMTLSDSSLIELTENDAGAFFVNISPKSGNLYFSWGSRDTGYKIKSISPK